MAEAAVSTLVALAKAGLEACRDAQTYKQEAARIGKRLTWVVARTEQWRLSRGRRGDDTFQRFYEALDNVHMCMQAASREQSSWRARIQNFLAGKELLTAILHSENQLNAVLQDFHLEQSIELSLRIDEGLSSITDLLEKFAASKS